ncbi:cyclic peptide export ABC transporter [Nannocystis radixulma]|uniref:Cyclic peptide export ABC transporter n=1 Tax=Nannocystis radixulma TaxID=2995305 RepID=A0ABT5B1L0_9BACT|nr:cyclic peptide export ABC transporter [Nannocystis radixulma]MDC0667993.1 cyclic peptide export ABC transporter [Nannocystis radixulma]
MKLLGLEVASPGQQLAVVGAVTAAGLANALAITIVSGAAQSPAGAGVTTLLTFAAAAVVSIGANRWASHRLNALVETGLYRTRVRFFEKIERTELRGIEAIGPTEIVDRLAQNMAIISAAASSIGRVMQALSIVAFALIYVAFLSPAAFVVIAALQIGALLQFRAAVNRTDAILRNYDAARLRFFDRLMGLLRGAKEIKLSRARSRDVRAEFAAASAGLRDASTRFDGLIDDSYLFLNAQLYLVLAGLVFVLPQYVALADATLSILLTTTLFLWGNIEGAIIGYPAYVQAAQATEALASLERRLDGAARKVSVAQEAADWPGQPGPLELCGVEYAYPASPGENAFRVGPVDLTVAPGEVVFIVGGNGSGKSTLLKTLTGLYPPTRGRVRLGGVTVDATTAAAFREQVSLILADFHLFSRTYGLDVSPEQVQPLLRQMQLAGKTAYKDGRFTRRDLSTGQRKRLALVLAMLEDRPILVLDEWPADQDPEFRRHFYEVLIPAWRAQGKIVIAVSHDDRYFHCADRLLVLDYGRVRA